MIEPQPDRISPHIIPPWHNTSVIRALALFLAGIYIARGYLYIIYFMVYISIIYYIYIHISLGLFIACTEKTIFQFPFKLNGIWSWVTVFLSIYQSKGKLNFRNSFWKENCHHDHIPFNLKGKRNIVFSVQEHNHMSDWRCLIHCRNVTERWYSISREKNNETRYLKKHGFNITAMFEGFQGLNWLFISQKHNHMSSWRMYLHWRNVTEWRNSISREKKNQNKALKNVGSILFCDVRGLSGNLEGFLGYL